MNLPHETSPIDGAMHRNCIVFLQAAAVSNSMADLARQLPGVFTGNEQYTVVPSGPLLPRSTFVSDLGSKQMVIILQGMIGFDKVQACLTGWGLGGAGGPPSPYPYRTAASQLVGTGLNQGPGFSWNEILIIGHSYGGAVAPHLAQLIPNQTQQTNTKVYTYGAPKTGTGTSLGVYVRDNTRRVFLNNDPVPNLPLSYEELSTLWVLTGVPTARAWSRWSHDVSGYTCLSNFTMVQSQRPTREVSGAPIFTLASWMTGVEAFGSNRHSLADYYDAMFQVPAVIVQSADPAPEMAFHNHRRPTAQQMEESRDLALAAAGNATEGNVQDAIRSVLSGVPLVAGEIFHGRANRGVQEIVYDENVVLTARTRRTRRALVRQLNRTLRAG